VRAWKIWRAVSRASHLVAKGDLDGALEWSKRAVSLAPENALSHLQLALTHLERGEPEAALAELSVPHDAANPAWPVFEGLARADAGDLEGARRLFDEALRQAPQNRLARGFQAVVMMRQGRPAEALAELEASGVEASHRLLGRLLVEVERTLAGLGASEGSRLRETSLSPVSRDGDAPPVEDAPEGTNLPWGERIARNGLLDRLVGGIVDPLFAQLFVSRAEKALYAQRSEAAIVDAREAVRRCPEVPRGFCVLGLAYLQEKQPRAALACLREAARRDGETPDVLYALGCCHHEMGELDEARRCLTRMLEGFAKDAAAHYTLGQIDLEEGDALAARRRFEYAAFLDFLLVRERLRRLSAVLAERDAAVCAQP